MAQPINFDAAWRSYLESPIYHGQDDLRHDLFRNLILLDVIEDIEERDPQGIFKDICIVINNYASERYPLA